VKDKAGQLRLTMFEINEFPAYEEIIEEYADEYLADMIQFMGSVEA